MQKQQAPITNSKLNRMDGKIELAFRQKGEITRLSHSHHSSPLKASRALYLDESGRASVYLMETSGGMVEGDTNHYHISVEKDSSVSLIPQSSTKVYPAVRNLPSRQNIEIELGEQSTLTWQPETIIPFKDSIFLGETIIKLQSSSSLVFSEIFSSGREKSEESFEFKRFSSKTIIHVDEKLIVYDHVNFSKQDAFSQLGMFEDCSYMGTIWFMTPSAKLQEFEDISQHYNQSPNHRFGFTSLDDYGVHFRWLSNDLCLLKEQMKELISMIS